MIDNALSISNSLSLKKESIENIILPLEIYRKRKEILLIVMAIKLSMCRKTGLTFLPKIIINQ